MDQETLRNFWRSAPDGRLCPWEQAKALGLREASKDLHGGQTNLVWIADRVTKVGGGHPSTSALHQFFKLVDADADWFPGRRSGKKRGPQPLLTAAKRKRSAQSAMAAKRKRREEPCAPAVVHACPSATWNPSTGKVFSEPTIRKVFLEDCYDFDPQSPWRFQNPLWIGCAP